MGSHSGKVIHQGHRVLEYIMVDALQGVKVAGISPDQKGIVYIAIAERFNDGGIAIQLKTGCELDQFANR